MLGLLTETDEAWASAALADVDGLLIDHAHCEMKAASNALSLAVRYGDRSRMVTALIAIAEEELAHFRQVHERLVARGLNLGIPPVDPYAATLRKAVGAGRNPTLVDRLLVCAMIEARSCERFRLLSEHGPDDELRGFYKTLLASEAGHYRTFVDLAIAEGARDGVDEPAVRARLRDMAQTEATIVNALSTKSAEARAAVHG
jgi:tRNA-(ms[2]io[6]A)-hydroxylase